MVSLDDMDCKSDAALINALSLETMLHLNRRLELEKNAQGN